MMFGNIIMYHDLFATEDDKFCPFLGMLKDGSKLPEEQFAAIEETCIYIFDYLLFSNVPAIYSSFIKFP